MIEKRDQERAKLKELEQGNKKKKLEGEKRSIELDKSRDNHNETTMLLQDESEQRKVRGVDYDKNDRRK